MPTVVLPTTTPPTSAWGGRTTGTRTCSTAPSTGTATQKGEPISSVPTGSSTRRARSSATILTGLIAEVGLPVTAVMRTASSIFPKLLFLAHHLNHNVTPWFFITHSNTSVEIYSLTE